MEILQEQTPSQLTQRIQGTSIQGSSELTTAPDVEGLLVETFCISPFRGKRRISNSESLKCLQCGDLFDRTILENRRRSYLNHPHSQLMRRKAMTTVYQPSTLPAHFINRRNHHEECNFLYCHSASRLFC